MDAGLIFIEGMTGAGKSTTAANIERWLASRGRSVRRYHELDDDNPIRTRSIDAMRANHPQVGPLPDTGADGFARDPSVYAPSQWGAIARRAVEDDQTIILESRYVQNSLQGRYLAGAPVASVYDGFAKIHAQVDAAHPFFVYLHPEDIRAHVRRTLETRDPACSPTRRTIGTPRWKRSTPRSATRIVEYLRQERRRRWREGSRGRSR